MKSLIDALKALADENRLKILMMLMDGDLCVGALAGHLGISKPAVSQHLQILRKARLVQGEKRSYWTHYSVDRQALMGLAAQLHALAVSDPQRAAVCWRIFEMPLNKPHRREVVMCDGCCQQPRRLLDEPEKCTPEQIRECHGKETHPGQGDPQDDSKR
jgi:ArsR family transcriptional regulator, arsenate/arsenite/antimonite-responsive transcriptional repressor